MMMIRFNSAKHSDKTPGLGFNVTVEAYRSGIHNDLISRWFTFIEIIYMLSMKKNHSFVVSQKCYRATIKMYGKILKVKSCNIWGFSSLKNNLIA